MDHSETTYVCTYMYIYIYMRVWYACIYTFIYICVYMRVCASGWWRCVFYCCRSWARQHNWYAEPEVGICLSTHTHTPSYFTRLFESHFESIYIPHSVDIHANESPHHTKSIKKYVLDFYVVQWLLCEQVGWQVILYTHTHTQINMLDENLDLAAQLDHNTAVAPCEPPPLA